MNLVGLFKIACHFRQEPVGAYSHVDGKAKGFIDFILNLMRQCYWIRIQVGSPCHIQEAFIDGKLLYHRCIFPANIHKRLGALAVQGSIRMDEHQVRALSKCHGHRLSGSHSIGLGRYRLCHNDAGSLILITAYCRWNQAKIRLALLDPVYCRPGQKCTIHIYMKNQSFHLLSTSGKAIQNCFCAYIQKCFYVYIPICFCVFIASQLVKIVSVVRVLVRL